MAFKYEYQLTKRAESDLNSIVSYIAVELANIKAAANFLDELQVVIDEIRMFPESGFLVENEFIKIENIRKKLIGNYIMYYFFNQSEKLIYILRIVYSRRNIDEIIKKMDI